MIRTVPLPPQYTASKYHYGINECHHPPTCTTRTCVHIVLHIFHPDLNRISFIFYNLMTLEYLYKY